MFILGISCFYHDSAAALLSDGDIVAAAQEERFTRKKHDPSFPSNAVRYCLEEGSVSAKELSAVVFYDKPFIKFERLLETYYAFAPKGLSSFVAAIPVWIKEKLFLKRLIIEELSRIEHIGKNGINLLFPEHHLSHACSAFFPSPFEESAILTIDGVGEWATASISYGKGNRISILRELRFPHSIGLLYSAFTYYLGFKVNSGEYKLMGLAPYGNPESDLFKKYLRTIKENLVDVKDDGSIWLNQTFFDYASGLRMVNDDAWKSLFGIQTRKPEDDITREHCDLALAIQRVTEEIVHNMAAEAKRLTGSRHLCLAGGVALNCVANGKLLKSGLFDNIWIQPAAGDAGGALGGAYCAYHVYFDRPRSADGSRDKMKGSYLGPEFSETDALKSIKQYRSVYTRYDDPDELYDGVARLLQNGNVVGWFQGRMEWGPRALGNRSILADARSQEMQKKLNLKIKFREGFRPFAPSVVSDDTSQYFDIGTDSPYMLLVAELKESHRKELPKDYHNLAWREKLYHIRSDIPAVTHIDYTARLQTVHKDTNPVYWQLLNAFKKLTGYGLIVNTSFNVRGEPIVCTPVDAYRCFMRTEMDYLVIGKYLFSKSNQPVWQEETDWRKEYNLD